MTDPADLDQRVQALRERIAEMPVEERIRVSAGPAKGSELDRLRQLLDDDENGESR